MLVILNEEVWIRWSRVMIYSTLTAWEVSLINIQYAIHHFISHSLILDFFTLIELAEMAKLAVFGCLEKYLFTLFCFELRKAQKSHVIN